MATLNPETHLSAEVLDQYSVGALREDAIPGAEEHLLCCTLCQSKLVEADEFVEVFRAAAMRVIESPMVRNNLLARVFGLRTVSWAGAVGLAVLAMGVFAVNQVSKQSGHGVPATVLMQSFRGSEPGAPVAVRTPAVLLFDIPEGVSAADSTVEIADSDGKTVLRVDPVLKDGKLAALADSLGSGDYWVRLYRRSDKELLGEYSVRANK
jgi:hypothetical protein